MTEITLTHGDARATIALLGAEARSWRVAGRDLLWPGDPAIWSDISPILYPVVGWTRDGEERVDGVRYPLALHGFARFETFAVESSAPDFARLTLSDNARTRAVYPFAFALAIEYRLSADALAIAIEVANPGERRAPYACGLHPGFRWPLGAAGREGALVQFDKSERPEVPRTRARRTCPQRRCVRFPFRGRDLPLSDALFAHDALCFLDCASRSLAFIDASGASITMEFRELSARRRYGRGPTRRSSASRPGPVTATRTGSTAICSTSRACACWSRESARATRRASSSGRSEVHSKPAQGRSMTDASAFVLDGAAIADESARRVAEEARALVAHGVTPGLAVVLVGDNPASQTYVAGKGRAAKACGFHSIQHNLPAETSEAELLTLVQALNADPAVHGILVQLPLPKHIDSSRVLEAIAPAKDVDGFHPINVGLLSIGDTQPRADPLHAGRRDDPHRQGLRAARLDASRHGGGDRRPLEHRRQADGAAAARAPLHGDHRPFAHPRPAFGRAPRRHSRRRRRPAGDGARRLGQAGRDRDRRRHQPRARQGHDASGKPKTRLVGDVAYAEAAAVAGAITPVPGGVGRMTIAMLMANTVLAAKRAAGL